MLRIIAITSFLVACATVAAGQTPVSDRVHQGDILDVDVVGGFEYDWRGGLTPEGFLDSPEGFADPVLALCRTESEIAGDIAAILGKILREPKVTVKIVDRSNRALVYLDGAVKTPTRFQIKRKVNLRELIVMAGGLIDGASGDISIFRMRNGSCEAEPETGTGGGNGNPIKPLNIKIADLLSGVPTSDPMILNGDLITVQKALPIYVIGAVANPRPIYSREKMTVARVIATAGGFTRDADGKRAVIYRRSGLDVSSVQVDLLKIKNGESEDEVLKPFDILEVVGKAAATRKYPPVTTIEQNIIRPIQNLPLRVVE